MSLLAERAMLVRPTISIWDGEVVDRRASDDSADRHNANRGAVVTTKRLIAKETIDPIKKEGAALRAYVKAETLPWRWDGVGLLPSANFFDFMEGWRTHHSQFEASVRSLLQRWGVHVRTGQKALGDLANDFDYPTQKQVALKFSAAIEVFPVPDAQDFRAQVTEAEAEAIRQQLQENADLELVRAQSYMWEQMQSAIERIVARLGNYKTDTNDKGKEIVVVGRIHDSLMDNLKLLTVRLGRLNLTNDPAINAMRLEMDKLLGGYTSQDLRDNADTRKHVHNSAEELLEQMRAGGFLAQAAAE